MIVLGIALASAIGAPTRYLLDRIVQRHTRGEFPAGTLVINTTGSLLLGFLTGLALYRGFPDAPKTVLGTGFCGGYTTFSTFTYETVRLAEDGAPSQAWRNSLASLFLPAVAAGLGLLLAAV